MKNLLKLKWALLAAVLLAAGCQTPNPNWKEDSASAEPLHRSLKQITDVIVHDIFSPPVASRIYAYSNIAAYEAMQPGYPEYQPLAGQLRDLKPAPQPEAGKEYCYPLAGAKAMLVVGKKLIFSEEKIDEFEQELLYGTSVVSNCYFHCLLRQGGYQQINMPQDVFERSLAYGQAVGEHVIAWSGGDQYKQSRTFPKYTITDDPARWRPTPPDYMDAVEPHWFKIRPLTLDTCSQFAPPPPPKFDMTDKNSEFYKYALEVYNALKVDSAEMNKRVAIAKFWDCNPYVSHHKGHVMFATKKITPGGHWMGITQTACRKVNADVMQSASAYVLVSLSLLDGFISCWDEKYRSQVVRPETVINTFIDPEWAPLLQTPPFPEYTSGHSVISTAAATSLTSIFGENFAYVDSVEVEFGQPARSFGSFMEACNEAAVSRLYGGIHYTPACKAGQEQGAKVGQHVVGKIKLKKGLAAGGGG